MTEGSEPKGATLLAWLFLSLEFYNSLGKSPVLITRFLGNSLFLEQLLFLERISQSLVTTGESTSAALR